MCADAGRALPGAGLNDLRAGEQVEILMPGHAGRGLDARLPGGQHGMGIEVDEPSATLATAFLGLSTERRTSDRTYDGSSFVWNTY